MVVIIHNLRNINYATDFNQVSAKRTECEALHFSTKHGIIQCWKLKLFLNFRVHSQRECILYRKLCPFFLCVCVELKSFGASKFQNFTLNLHYYITFYLIIYIYMYTHIRMYIHTHTHTQQTTMGVSFSGRSGRIERMQLVVEGRRVNFGKEVREWTKCRLTTTK